MNSLFIKIFLYFLLVIILASGIGMVLAYTRDRHFPPLENRHFAHQAMSEYGREAAAQYQQGGQQALRTYTLTLVRKTGIRARLFTASGKALSVRRVRPRLEQLVQQAVLEQQIVMLPGGNKIWLASPLSSAKGENYVIAVGLPGRPGLRKALHVFAPHAVGTRLLILLTVAAFICFFLARSLTAPIRKLREATHHFARGELSTRVGHKLRGHNEITDLGQDFDRMAERIEDLIGSQRRLLRDISHELRSPLARLSVALELARQRSGQEAHNSLDRIEKEAGQLNDMIGQLLNLTQLETGGQLLQKSRFDLAQLLHEIVQDADFEARGEGCVTKLISDAEQIRVDGVENLLRRALENVVRNAVRYTATGTTVEVNLQRKGSRQVQILVRDHGPGVPEESLTKLFEPFYRVASARDRQSGGTGIGLTIAQKALQLHQGTIRATNHPQGGLVMEINLPVEVD